MNRNTWRQLASGLLAATLSLGIAACDDDTSSATGDMAVGADMSATVGPDMAGAVPGNGQITLADVVGTLFVPTSVNANGFLPRTHVLLSIASFPKPARMGDPSSDLTLGPPPHGCLINRYTATNLPGTDGDAGNITISGFNTASTVATDAKTGSTMGTPTPITCKLVSNHYVCTYAGTFNPDGGAMGASTSDVIYPIVPNRCVLLNPATHMPTGTTCPPPGDQNLGWKFGQMACDTRYVPNPSDPVPGCTAMTFPAGCATAIEVCEQHPLTGDTEIVTETVAGGADYPMSTSTLGNGVGPDGGTFPNGIYLVSVTQGTSTTNLAGTDPLQLGPSLSMNAPLDPTKDVTISYSCDATATVGSGCGGSSDLVALLVQTSIGTRAAFATPGPTGVGQCIGLVTGGSITVKAAQLTALLGGQTGGSIELALARLVVKINAKAGAPLVVATAGAGVFGFTNQ